MDARGPTLDRLAALLANRGLVATTRVELEQPSVGEPRGVAARVLRVSGVGVAPDNLEGREPIIRGHLKQLLILPDMPASIARPLQRSRPVDG